MPQEPITETRCQAGLSTREQKVLGEVLKALRQVRYGSITIIIQDGRIVQIDYTEKVRLGREPEPSKREQ
ncbi:YezD family protein [Moorella sp. ACPs]|uniref:YezD family protein n=1 Tax=Neomoorella carbonis TaxID=3062783 RepID=UPI0032435F25